MPTKLEVYAEEESSFTVGCVFKDEDNTPITPSSANWTFTDKDGNVINSRQNVNITDLSSTIYITLSGDDLQILPADVRVQKKYTNDNGQIEKGEFVKRIFTLQAIYNSSYGSNLTLKKSAKIWVEDLDAVV